MLKVNNIEVVYNEVILVLKGISQQVPEFGVIALLGANGAGKSTTLKAITGILETQNGELKEGTIEFMGKPIHKIRIRTPREVPAPAAARRAAARYPR